MAEVTETGAALVSNVLTEATFDTDQPTVLGWLTRAERKMCARARCYRKTIALGLTVAEQRDYAVPDEVSEILEVDVEGVLYGSARRSDASVQPVFVWEPNGDGFAGRDDDAEGNPKLLLYPTPTEGGAPISIWAVCVPPALTADAVPKVPPDFYDALVSGAIATGLLRLESREDLAAPHESRFNEACQELRRQTNQRFRGAGPTLIRVAR